MTVATAIPPLARARTAFEQGDFDDALRATEAAVAADLNSEEACATALHIARNLHDPDLALRIARRMLELAPQARARRALVMWLADDVGASAEAIAIARALAEEEPGDCAAWTALARFLRQTGDFDGARAAIENARRADPSAPETWHFISQLKTFSNDDPDFAALKRLVARAGDDTEGARLHYALGKAHDDVGDADGAFACFERGARCMIGDAIPPTEKKFSDAARARAAFPPERFTQANATERRELSVQVMGCARSGTTLLERILATSPRLTPGGELPMLTAACLALAPPSPENVDALVAKAGSERAAWDRIADGYLRRLKARFGVADGVIDKGLYNFLYMGAAALALPGAKIVHVRRDPIDVAWSCYRRRFHSHALAWTYHFTSIAKFLRIFEDMAAYWREVLPDQVLELRYEDLVAEPERETARLFAFLELERPPNWREFHTSSGAVRTWSLKQVREPLNSKGVGAWRRYERNLGPLIEALAREGLTENAAS